MSLGISSPPRCTQIAWASGVARYRSSARACGVSLNIDHADAAPTCAPAYCVLTSGSGKKLKSVPATRLGFALVKKEVMKDAWFNMAHFGGFWNIGVPTSPKLVLMT